MMLGKPNNIDNYICVNSDQCIELHKLGFEPIYREITEDKIYFLRSTTLCKVVREKWNLIVK